MSGGVQRPRSLAMDDDTYRLLEAEAKDRGMTTSQLVRKLVQHSLDPANYRTDGGYGRLVPERIKERLALLLTGIIMTVGFIASVGAQTLL